MKPDTRKKLRRKKETRKTQNPLLMGSKLSLVNPNNDKKEKFTKYPSREEEEAHQEPPQCMLQLVNMYTVNKNTKKRRTHRKR